MKFKEGVMKIVKVGYEIEKSGLSEVGIGVADNIYKVFEEKLDSYFLGEKNDDGERGYHSFGMYSSYVFNEFISANIGMVNPLVTDIDKDIFFDLAQYHGHICEDYLKKEMGILKQNFDTEILFKEEEIEKLKQEYAILKDE